MTPKEIVEELNAKYWTDINQNPAIGASLTPKVMHEPRMTATKINQARIELGFNGTFDPRRQTGRTTRQMLSAPKGAVYVWPTAMSLLYAEDLATVLGREDLRITTPRRITPDWFNGHKDLPALIVDHATEFNHNLFQATEWHREETHKRTMAHPMFEGRLDRDMPDPPVEVMQAAMKVRRWFEMQGIKNGSLMGLCVNQIDTGFDPPLPVEDAVEQQEAESPYDIPCVNFNELSESDAVRWEVKASWNRPGAPAMPEDFVEYVVMRILSIDPEAAPTIIPKTDSAS